jgi:hypothetical protein
MATKSKHVFRLASESSQERAKGLTLSFHPRHLAIIRLREKQLNIPRSTCVQLLVEIEGRDGLVREEIIARLRQRPTENGGRRNSKRTSKKQ